MIFISLDRIKNNPWQTRQRVDPAYIRELAADIASRKSSRPHEKGLLQVPAGRIVDAEGNRLDKWTSPAGRIQLAYGHNRLAAFRLLSQGDDEGFKPDPDYDVMPVEIVRFTDEEMATAAWAENAQRRDLTAVEEALAIQKMMADFNLTQAQIAAKLALSPTTVSNKLRLLRLPGEVQTAVVERQITERQAVAILPALEMPASALAAAEASFIKPSELIAEAREGTSSEFLRDRAERCIIQATRRFDEGYGLVFPLDFHFDPPDDDENQTHPLQSARCDECELRVRLKNDLRCGDKQCFARKTSLWADLQLNIAEANLQLQRLDLGEQGYYSRVETFYHATNAAYVPEILAEGCPRDRLRLEFNENAIGGYFVPGVAAGVRVVCHHGQGDRCHCLAAKKAAKTRAFNEADPETIARQERERRVKALCAPAYEVLGAALRAGHEGAWRLMLGQMNYAQRGHAQNWDLERLAIQVAAEMLKTELIYHTDRPDSARQIIVRQFESAGLDLPWPEPDAADRIEKIDLEITDDD